MPNATDAWMLYASRPGEEGTKARLVRGTYEFPDISDDEVLAEPIYGCWEGNMGHALERKPIDICHFRSEPRVVLGNAGVLRVLQVGSAVTSVEPGQRALLYSGAVLDAYGYPEKIQGYDAPGTMGLLAKRIKLHGNALLPIPETSRFSSAQWAAFSGRYTTAWSNWRIAFGTLRLLLPEQVLPRPHVWGWGGGTTLAELHLARLHGCETVMMSANDRRLAEITRAGITPLDRRKIGNLVFDEQKYAADAEFRRAYMQSERAFLKEVKERTGRGVNVFVDHIGSAIFRATVKSLSREGIIATAGWKEGQLITFLRAAECIQRHQHINTHYASRSEAIDAMRFAEEHAWLPEVEDRPYAFDEIADLADAFERGDHSLFPVYAINAE